MFQKEEVQAKFNSGLALLERIDHLKRTVHTCFMVGNLDDAFDSLCGYHTEIWEFLDRGGKADTTERVDTLATIRNLSRLKEAFNKDKDRAYTDFWAMLMEFNRTLNDYNKKYGLSMIAKDSTSGAAEK